MDFLLFNLFSTLENSAAIVLLLSMFKYRVRDYVPQILLASLMMSLISHTMRFEFANSSWVPLITIITLYLFIWVAFRVSILYALIISVVGYVTYGLLQAILLYSLQFFGLLSLQDTEKPFSLQGYIIQFISFTLALAISYLLRQKNYGFNWIPYSQSAKFILKGDNIVLFIVVLGSVFVIGFVFFLYLSGYLHLLAIFVLIFMVLTLLLYLARRQEEKYYD